jgi:eukaryotic-like serine/threonine-protein kinase
VDHLRESSVVGGRFRLIEPVGTGRPAGVWRAVDLASGQAVAVKTLNVLPAADTTAQSRFREVARTVAPLSAPGLAEVREFGEAELDGARTVPYLVRELVSGPTLDERLTRGPLPAGEALRLVAEVAAALAVAHRAGVAHGHLVPGNIVLGPDRVMVTDAGLWPLRPRPAGGPVLGGLGYAAPELLHGPATPAADMYALGVVFVACLAGIASGGPRPPAAGELPVGASLDPVPAGLAALWAACLSPSPQERPSAAHAESMSRQLLPRADASAGGRRGPGRLAGRPPGRRSGRGRWHPVLASKVTAAVTAATVAAALVLVALLASSSGDQPGRPASAAAQARTTVAAGLSAPGRGPTPESTRSVLASTPSPAAAPSPAALSPIAAINQLALTIGDDVADGQVRPDVGVDFGNLIDPAREDLASGQPVPVAQLAGELRVKLWTRVSEDAVTLAAATVLNRELTALADSTGAAG